MMTQFDRLRFEASKLDALAAASEDLFDGTMFDDDIDRQRVERCASLIGMVREAAERMLTVVDAFNADLLETKISDACAPAIGDWEAGPGTRG